MSTEPAASPALRRARGRPAAPAGRGRRCALAALAAPAGRAHHAGALGRGRAAVLGYVLLSRVTAGLLDAKQRSARRRGAGRPGRGPGASSTPPTDRPTPAASCSTSIVQPARQPGRRRRRALRGRSLLAQPGRAVDRRPARVRVQPRRRVERPGRRCGTRSAETQRQCVHVHDDPLPGRPTVVPGFAVGAPLSVPGVGTYELYYLFPLTQEQDTLALVAAHARRWPGSRWCCCSAASPGWSPDRS